MNADVYDVVLATFLGAIDGGFNSLMAYALPLLGVLAVIMFYTTMAPVIMSGAGIGEALAACVWTVVTIGVYYYLITYLPYLTDAALQTFVQWGLAPAGAFTLGDFLLPSRIIRAGWTAAYPVGQLMMMMKGKVAPWNWHTLAIYLFAWLVIIGSFAVLAYEAIAALLNYHLAVMASPVLFPWGVLRHTGFLAELSLAWIVAGLIQIFLMAGIMGISVGLFEMASQLPNPAADRDPGISEAIVMAIIATFFAGLAWTVPKRAASLGGRGMALALTGADIYLPLWRAAAPVGAMAIRGTSAMLSAGAARIATSRQTPAQGRPS